MSKLALAGISFGGQLAPLAAAREDRFSALILIDGLRSMRKAIAVGRLTSNGHTHQVLISDAGSTSTRAVGALCLW